MTLHHRDLSCQGAWGPTDTGDVTRQKIGLHGGRGHAPLCSSRRPRRTVLQSLKPREKRGYQVEYDKSLNIRTTLPDLTAGVGQPWIDLDCFRALLTQIGRAHV